MVREEEYNLILRSSRLFQQFAVDTYIKMEQCRLRFIERNQKDYRRETLQGMTDMNMTDYNTEDIGQKIILSASFTGGERYMRQLL